MTKKPEKPEKKKRARLCDEWDTYATIRMVCPKCEETVIYESEKDFDPTVFEDLTQRILDCKKCGRTIRLV